jgi:endonuclease/exonuclease/phosphatase family metal-dependent hydrolase
VAPTVAVEPDVTPDTIRIASFNIQVFGTSKSKKSNVMDVLAKVVRRFDVVAIQEIRSKDPQVVPKFVDRINAEGDRYDYVIGPRLGRTSCKEQYAFIFDTARIEVDRDSIHTAADPDDLLHREPLVTRFQVRDLPPDQAFSFVLINIHTDPDETKTELNALDDVFVAVGRNVGREDDVILLGDLNVNEKHLGQLGALPNITWVVSGKKTNTRRTKSYDNIVFDRQATTEYTGSWGVLDLMAEYGLSMQEAIKVSDHLPVWAEFTARETQTTPAVATRPKPLPR